MRPRTRRWAALIALAAAAAGCASPCEQRRGWRSQAQQPCQTCLQHECSMEINALAAAPFECMPELACAGRCPDQSSETCGCEESCLATDACRAPFDAYTRCAVAKCDAACR